MPTAYPMPDGSKPVFNTIEEARAFKMKNFPVGNGPPQAPQTPQVTPGPLSIFTSPKVQQNLLSNPKEGKAVTDVARSIVSLTQPDKPSPASEKERSAVLRELGAVENLASAFKDMETSGTPLEKDLGRGRISGFLAKLTGATGINPAIHPYEGQLAHTAVSLARIATGGSQGITKMAQYYYKALPDVNANWQEFARHMTNAVQDAYVMKSAREGKTYDVREAADAASELIGRYMPQDELEKFKKDKFVPVGAPKQMEFGKPVDTSVRGIIDAGGED